MRGDKSIGQSRFATSIWITPACAGISELTAIDADAVEDHPRMRGDKLQAIVEDLPGAGSPPHARG